MMDSLDDLLNDMNAFCRRIDEYVSACANGDTAARLAAGRCLFAHAESMQSFTIGRWHNAGDWSTPDRGALVAACEAAASDLWKTLRTDFEPDCDKQFDVVRSARDRLAAVLARVTAPAVPGEPAQAARDKFAYQLYLQGMRQRVIVKLISDVASEKGWEPIGRTALLKSVDRHIRIHGLPPRVRRKRGPMKALDRSS